MIYKHQIRVRYGELDPQGVVFNANYLAYCDDAMDRWLHSTILKNLEELGLDVMLKKVILEWDAPARLGDELLIEVQVLRWGNTSYKPSSLLRSSAKVFPSYRTQSRAALMSSCRP